MKLFVITAMAVIAIAFTGFADDAVNTENKADTADTIHAIQADSVQSVQAIHTIQVDSIQSVQAIHGIQADSAQAGQSVHTVADTIAAVTTVETAEDIAAPLAEDEEEVEKFEFGGKAAITFDDVTDDLDAGPNRPEPEPVIERAPITPAIFGRPNRLDGIAAVVGSQIILRSELETYAFMRFVAMETDSNEINITEFLRVSLNELIDDKVLLVRAMADSMITVRNDEVESMLNNHINNILHQNRITTEELDRQLRTQQGTTLARFRSEARRAIREQLYKQKLQQSYYFTTSVNRRDVERFYERYIDSLPVVGESFEMLKLSLRLASSDSVRQAAYDKIHYIKKQLDAGADFGELAMKYSDGPEGQNGGSLGFLEMGSTTELILEERAFALQVGHVSDPFETRFGYHIIVVDEKRDRRVRLRQIFVKHMPTEHERDAVMAQLDSLRQTITTKVQFEAAARSLSVDAATRTRGGKLGWITLMEMPPVVRGAVHNLDDGQISAPVAEENMLSIYMVNSRVDSRRLTLENDYQLLAEKAKDITAQKRLLDNVQQWRERVFIDIRI